MKNLMFPLFILGFHFLAAAQDPSPRFSVAVSSDSILLGNYFRVTFTLENARQGDFEAPEFEGFQIVSGPNFSSSMSMVNGTVTQKISYSYYLEPLDIGNYYIPPASITVGNNVLESLPVSILVTPNPDGIKQLPDQELEWSNGFDDAFPDLFEQFFKNKQQMDSFPAPPPSKPQPEPKKKKKVYKM